MTRLVKLMATAVLMGVAYFWGAEHAVHGARVKMVKQISQGWNR